jgi:hypothetical protein
MDTRRELGLINKHVRLRNREAGENVVWYEFKDLGTGGSVYDDVYDEGVPGAGGKSYDRGLIVPTIYVEEVEDEFRAIDDGRQPTQNLRATILFKDIEAAGVTNPREYNKHLNDLFEYDSRYYRVRSYRVRGRMNNEHPNGEAMLLVTGVEIFPDQEMPFSFGPRNPAIHDLPWPTSFPS